MKNAVRVGVMVFVIIVTIMVAMVHAKSVTTYINNEGHVRRATIPMNVPVNGMVGDHKDVMTIDDSKVVDARQLWSAPLQYAEYTTTMMSSRPATSGAYDSPVFATGDYLNDPVEANAMDVNGRVIFNFLGASSEAEFIVSTARHINTYPAGDVDVAVAEHSSWARPPFTCTLFGFIARDGKSAKPVWTYTIPSCMASFEDNDWPSLAMSDDGSTVAFSFASNITDGRDYGVLSAQIHVLDAQSGKLLWSKDCRSIDKTVSPSVSISRHGEFIAFSNGNITYVINRDGTPRGTPFDKKISVPCHICPMGTFITWGAWDAHVSKWNATANAYQDRFVIPGRDKQGNEWFVESMATTINGGGSHPDGCLAAFGWTLTSDNARQSRVDIYNMFTAKLYWSWTSAHTTQVQTLPYLSFHMGYLAVAHWGNDDASDPQTLLFGLGSNKPLFTFTSPGSMFDVDVAVMGSPIPTFDDYDTAPVPAPRAPDAVDQIWITCGGKHVHASVMGNGGDAYAFSVTVNATAAAAPYRAV